MARIQINTRYRKPTWKEVFGDDDKGSHSMADYDKAIGATFHKLTGKIGHQGTKVHVLAIFAVETPEGLGIINGYSSCGSARWNSGLSVIADDDLSLVTCEKCKKRMGL